MKMKRKAEIKGYLNTIMFAMYVIQNKIEDFTKYYYDVLYLNSLNEHLKTLDSIREEYSKELYDYGKNADKKNAN